MIETRRKSTIVLGTKYQIKPCYPLSESPTHAYSSYHISWRVSRRGFSSRREGIAPKSGDAAAHTSNNSRGAG